MTRQKSEWSRGAPLRRGQAIRTTGAVLADARQLGQSERKEDGGEGGPNTGSRHGEETISSAHPFWAAIFFPFKLHDCQFGRRFVAVGEGGDSVEWHDRDFLEASVGKARNLIRVDERSDRYGSNNKVAYTKLDGSSWHTESLAERRAVNFNNVVSRNCKK